MAESGSGFDRFFRLRESGTDVRTEVTGGLVTFLAMAYIIFVQPAVLSGAMFGRETGMDFGAVTAATCVSAAVASALMGFYARYPIAQAPGMGENFFFVFSALPAAAALPAVRAGETSAWQVALGTVFVSGVLFLLLSLTPLRERLFDAISPSMKSAIAAGIGIFIAFIGLQNAGVVVKDPGTAVRLNSRFLSPDLLVFGVGLFVTAALHARRVRGAMLWGIGGATALAVALKLALPHLPAGMADAPAVVGSGLARQFAIAGALVAPPPSLGPTLLRMDVAHALSPVMLPFVAIFLFMVLFDTIGTLVGVAGQAGFIRDNRLPRARQAMLSDAVGTVVGASLGTSTVTSFVESAAGVEHGARTGLASLVTAALFLLALCFGPVIAMVGSYAPITAPALVVVGAMMIRHVRAVDWDDPTEVIPAFLVLIGIPLTYSIGDGLAIGFIAHPLIKCAAGRRRDVTPLGATMAVVLLLYFVFIRAAA